MVTYVETSIVAPSELAVLHREQTVLFLLPPPPATLEIPREKRRQSLSVDSIIFLFFHPGDSSLNGEPPDRSRIKVAEGRSPSHGALTLEIPSTRDIFPTNGIFL